MSATPAPISTTMWSGDVAGVCHIQLVFNDRLNKLLAGLDWARVHSSAGTVAGNLHAARELEAAAKHARALADQCEEYARKAREIGPTDRRAPKFPRENRRADQQRENER